MSSRMYCLTMLLLSFAVTGCTEATNSSADISAASATPVVFNAGGAPTVDFSVPDMSCPDGCAPVVKETLAKQPGAIDVIVDFEAKTATVAIDRDKFDAEQALAALVDRQFGNSSLKEIATAKPQAAGDSAVQ
jgi:copper chaperone CopZ